ncbi:MAG: exodeoxyribonuclease III [Corynebacterium glucuronolyticum]|nr:exodeoxyribonuclease III [Corynebacterium glucuronolyticum]MDD7585455.1 exodeoxyribonuclease III [Mycobacteriaceae bacterium]MDY5835203.1 exodeoxyribonuclease III [Corynebacterium glucuronolyticum]
MSHKIASINVNGIRAATSKNPGFHDWLRTADVDIVLLQEVRATPEQAQKALAPALAEGWNLTLSDSVQKGRAGVAILTTQSVADVRMGLPGFEDSGRFVSALVDDLFVASLYLPTGSAGTAKQDEKYRFLDSLEVVLASIAAKHEKAVVAGDWNICHAPNDLKNFASNKKKAGCLPDERAFMDSVFGTYPFEESQVESHGSFVGAVDYVREGRREASTSPQWFDVARRLHPEDAPYTWWTYRGKAFDTNAGWRIDVQAATKAMMERAESTRVDRADAWGTRWSDHAPLVVTYRD